MTRRLTIAITCLALAGWQWIARADEPDASPPVVAPTDEDKAIVDAFNALAGEPQLRELVYETQNWGAAHLERLLGKQPATASELQDAREFLRRRQAQVEAGRNFPAAPPYSIVRTQQTIAMDGRLDEAAWTHAQQALINIKNASRDADDAPIATCRLLWDQQRLYVAFEVRDSNILAPDTEHDADVWWHDAVELFIMPDQRFGQYWEINITPLGTVRDVLLTKYQDKWFSYELPDQTVQGLERAVTVKGTVNQEGDQDTGYIIEFSVPFDQLPGMARGPMTGDVIYGLMAVADRTRAGEGGGPYFRANAAMLAGYHNVWGYSPFTFVDSLSQSE